MTNSKCQMKQRRSRLHKLRNSTFGIRHLKVVAREGSAPPTSGCRPDVILFHHRAIGARLCRPRSAAARHALAFSNFPRCGWSSTQPRSERLAAGNGFAPLTSLSKSDELLITPSRSELVEPEVVATSPYRIKSPVPVCCGFDSLKLVGERGLAPPRLTDSRSVGSAIPA